jgi:ATP-dependent Clp protease adapter protein ClpS
MSMTEAVAQDTMMQAHTYGFAVAGEWGENDSFSFRFFSD